MLQNVKTENFTLVLLRDHLVFTPRMTLVMDRSKTEEAGENASSSSPGIIILYQIHTNANVFILLLGKVVIQDKSQTETTLLIFFGNAVTMLLQFNTKTLESSYGMGLPVRNSFDPWNTFQHMIIPCTELHASHFGLCT